MRRVSRAAARPAIAVLALVGSLVACDLLVGRFVPRIRVYSELLEGEPYPAAPSAYLPFTTPVSATFRHTVEGREIEYRFNHLGFRGPHPASRDRPLSTRRILVCGDSFVLGWGNPLEDTFVELLRRRLAGRGFEVINAGYRGGYSPDSYYAYLLREGLGLEPALVVIALYGGNDLSDMRYNLWRRTDELGAPVELGTLRLYMDHEGRIIHPVERLDEILPWGYRVRWARQSHLFAAAAQALDRGLSRNRVGAAEAARRFDLVVEATARRLAASSVEVAYLLIPPHPDRAGAAQHAAGARMAATVAAHGAVIDLAGRLDGSAYFPRDAHFNARGNRLAYEALADGLARAGLLGAEEEDGPGAGAP